MAHKGNFGHALLLAGSYGKIGAAVLAAKACLSAGAGLLTTHVPSCGYHIMQSSVPEAMVTTDRNSNHLSELPDPLDIYQAAGFGPGIGKHNETIHLLHQFLKKFKRPLVLDADAINILGLNVEWLSQLHAGSILTPHPKEFDRLFGEHKTDLDRIQKAHQAAVQFKIHIVLKGHFTGVFFSDGTISFNTSGNAGMAKGGSGDTLTGIITALMSQSYVPQEAAALGVYLHGCAGDLAARLYSEEAMLPTDLINCLGKVFLKWKEKG